SAEPNWQRQMGRGSRRQTWPPRISFRRRRPVATRPQRQGKRPKSLRRQEFGPDRLSLRSGRSDSSEENPLFCGVAPPYPDPVSGKTLTLGHSPDPDDAFMFYGLAKELIPANGFRFQHILQDIQTLNERARRGELDITAISI